MSFDFVVSAYSATISFIREYQSLIAGLLAIWAASIAARPVWRQLEQMNVQASTTFREFLYDRIRILGRRQKWLSQRVQKFEEEITRSVYHFFEFEDGSVNPHWAFDQNQAAEALLGDIRKFHNDATDPPDLDTAIENLILSLSELSQTLDAIHRPASTDQSDEYHSFTDDEWAAIGREGLKAEGMLMEKASSFSESIKTLDDAFSAQLALLRHKVKKTDSLLMRPGY